MTTDTNSEHPFIRPVGHLPPLPGEKGHYFAALDAQHRVKNAVFLLKKLAQVHGTIVERLSSIASETPQTDHRNG
ncbi:MAG: hypothetical protein JNM43_00415 [Planctomycetaceae bacterium]|nr:hypothetical protein [Planctomycetaceae bacterium]